MGEEMPAGMLARTAQIQSLLSQMPQFGSLKVFLCTALTDTYNLKRGPLCFSCKEYKNLNSFFAIIMGLSNVAVSRLSLTWEVSLC